MSSLWRSILHGRARRACIFARRRRVRLAIAGVLVTVAVAIAVQYYRGQVRSAVVVAAAVAGSSAVRVGAEVLAANPECLAIERARERSWAVLTHAAAVGSDGEPDLQRILDAGFRVTRVFAPEHGVTGGGTSPGDTYMGVPVADLHGTTRRPTDDMFDGVNGLMVDLQDVGVRFFTYVSTMCICLEECAERGIPVVVLDRPNPIGGVVEGPMMEDGCRSFVGHIPTPVRHGMTMGEIAALYNRAELRGRARVFVVPVANWSREMWLDQTGLPWRRPSPGLYCMSSVIAYPATCFLEGTNVSEGRGTMRPFELVGAPWIDGEALARVLNAVGLPGCSFTARSFTPEGETVKYSGQECGGVMLHVTDRAAFRPVRASVTVLWALKQLYGDRLAWEKTGSTYFIDLLAGTPRVREMLDGNAPLAELRALCGNGGRRFVRSGVRAGSLLRAYDRPSSPARR